MPNSTPIIIAILVASAALIGIGMTGSTSSPCDGAGGLPWVSHDGQCHDAANTQPGIIYWILILISAVGILPITHVLRTVLRG